MSEAVTITRAGSHEFQVEIRQGSACTSHRVRVPRPMVEELGLGGVDPEELVRASFAFLLEREPPTSILPDFDLEVITRYFPDYPDDLVERCGTR